MNRDQKREKSNQRNIKMAEREGEDLNLTDYENYLLARYKVRDGIPQGLERLTDQRWVEHVKADLVRVPCQLILRR